MRRISEAMHEVMVATRRQPGCVACSLAAELGEHTSLHYVGEWKTEQDLAREVRSPRFVMFAELIERASIAPRVEFQVDGVTRGLEYAEEVRGAEAADEEDDEN
jgi:quinol monooxygenase YgiN